MIDSAQLDALVAGGHSDPFAVLGPHRSGKSRVVRCLQPNAASVSLININGDNVADMKKVHAGGVFEAPMPPLLRHYALRVTSIDGTEFDVEDPYRFPSTLGELDLYLLREGSDQHIFKKLGAQALTIAGVSGTRFAVWAPNASRVSVVGDFNNWDGRIHVMRLHPGNGIWEMFVPAAHHGAKYKYEIQGADGKLLPLKSDPYAAYHEAPPGNSSIVFNSSYRWKDAAWMAQNSPIPKMDQPIAIYEVHPGSWRRRDDGGYLGYRALADELVDYVREMGFTHIELLPVSEHPFDGSWGYQPIGLFAPTQRFGTPDDFRYFVDRCHAADISIIVDWVPAHFPKDEHGLARFDGSALYEHADPKKGEHTDWGTLIFNYGRREVVNYLIGSALYWIKELHIDAIRVDAVASMLYLDYSREDGEWIPNEHGGNENLEAVEFLKRFNTEMHAAGASTFAEESTAWPGVSRPVDSGGLGFTYKWNMGWMNDTLVYMAEDPIHRKFHHDKMTFGLVYAFTENFILPLSHDEVVHGKRSILGRMPGDEWQQFANLRAYYAIMYAHPGKKLQFMGNEIAQVREWDHDRSLDWHLLKQPAHAGVQTLMRDLNHLYRETPALFELDFDSSGFEWIDYDDRDNSILSWLRRDRAGEFVIMVANLTPITREKYSIGVPVKGNYTELLNTDSKRYGGSGIANATLQTTGKSHHGRPDSLSLRLPALATLIIKITTEPDA